MGCVSSTLLGHDEDFPQIGGSTTFGHHIVSLTSTTYGLLTLDPPPTPPSSSLNHSATTTTPTPPLKPEIINSWELMAGLDSTPTPDHSFRFLPLSNKENSNPNLADPRANHACESILNDAAPVISRKCSYTVKCCSVDEFEKICPPNGENKVVIYTTTLRGVRKTYEACNAVRSAVESFGVPICERDISMDRGFRDELRELLKGKESSGDALIPPRVFIKGRYIGGAEEVMRIVEQGGGLGDLLQGLPKLNKAGYNVCDGCGGARFLPCFKCNGSCKIVMEHPKLQQGRRTVVLRCSHCNENGLVLCPICS